MATILEGADEEQQETGRAFSPHSETIVLYIRSFVVNVMLCFSCHSYFGHDVALCLASSRLLYFFTIHYKENALAASNNRMNSVVIKSRTPSRLAGFHIKTARASIN
ncbi:hypothetical protein M758_UG117800 [Ceratodon purpureus]|nr:hypothetical protein M758_UG117800 [Ceratodon purpureus]